MKYPIKRDITARLSRFAAELSFFDLPDRTKRNLKLFLLDYVAAAHAGYRINIKANQAINAIVFEAVDNGASHVMFSSKTTSPLSAAFINAFCAHGADMDDGNKLAAGHIGAHVISSLMALSECRGKTFGQFYSAMAVGYEFFCRLSSACMPYLVDRGFHSTGTAGALASAVACARLLDLDQNGIENALALSATQASGLLLAGESRQDMKGLNPANAARAGIISALLAERGIQGPLKPLESDKGWFHAMTPEVNFEYLFEGLGECFQIDQSYLKPYPSCRHTHSAIEAALAIGKTIDPENIARIEVLTYGHAIDLAGRIDVPLSAGEAKFSIKFAVAVALSKGRFGLEDLCPQTTDAAILALVKKTTLIKEDRYELPEQGIRGACVVVTSTSGERLSKEVLIPKGEPDNPFDEFDIKDKLRACFSDRNGMPAPDKAIAFLNWYEPIASDPTRLFVFPEIGGIE